MRGGKRIRIYGYVENDGGGRWGRDLGPVTPFPRGAKPPLSRDISPLMTS